MFPRRELRVVYDGGKMVILLTISLFILKGGSRSSSLLVFVNVVMSADHLEPGTLP